MDAGPVTQVLEPDLRIAAQGDSGRLAGASNAEGVRSGEHVFLSTLPAGASQRRLALAVVLLSGAVFAVAAPFARVPLAKVDAFIPAYQAALALNDLTT